MWLTIPCPATFLPALLPFQEKKSLSTGRCRNKVGPPIWLGEPDLRQCVLGSTLSPTNKVHILAHNLMLFHSQPALKVTLDWRRPRTPTPSPNCIHPPSHSHLRLLFNPWLCSRVGLQEAIHFARFGGWVEQGAVGLKLQLGEERTICGGPGHQQQTI